MPHSFNSIRRNECEQHVKLYSGANYKKFKTIEEARHFLNEGTFRETWE
jgi:viroplasmin and RNaseH domain-containing protein